MWDLHACLVQLKHVVGIECIFHIYNKTLIIKNKMLNTILYVIIYR